MPRARNIKPGFFMNEQLGALDPLARILFQGMWCHADYRGVLEYRPMRLKVEILPYDDCDIEALTNNLDKSGLISMYRVKENTYVKVLNFAKHQNPHKNERDKGSELPDINDSGVKTLQPIDYKGGSKDIQNNLDKSGLIESDPADSLSLIPDSLSLIPDSLSLIPDSLSLIPEEEITPAALPNVKTNKILSDVENVFEHWKKVMNKNNSAKLTKERTKLIKARFSEGYTVLEITQAIDGCAATPHNMGQNDNGTRYDDIALICRSGSHLERFAGNMVPAEYDGLSPKQAKAVAALKTVEFFK